MSSVHRGHDAAKHLDPSDDEPTSITAFDSDGGTHDGRLLAASELGSLIAFGGHVVTFDAEGFSDDGALCLCPESIPAPRDTERPS